MEGQIGRSGKAIFQLHSEMGALDFWREPARAKLVLMYAIGCGWCDKFMPEFIKLAPVGPHANSDLLFGAAERRHLENVTKFIPALTVSGFPTTILVDSRNTVRHVIPGYMTAPDVLKVIEEKMPELKGLPSLHYMQAVRAGGIGSSAAAEVILPSRGPAEMTVGKGRLGSSATPMHFPGNFAQPTTVPAPMNFPPRVGGRKHKSRHPHHHQTLPDPNSATNKPPTPPARAAGNSPSPFCTIL